MNEKTPQEFYTPPMLTEVGEFNEDTLGIGFDQADLLILGEFD